MGDFARTREGFRFDFGGVKLNSAPDTLAPNKYALALNVRAYSNQSVRTRPGLTLLTTTTGTQITDLRAYAALLTDNLPRILARDVSDRIWLDTGAQVGTLAGGGASSGATLIPFRPNQSPNPYMYISNGTDYQKFSAPAAGVVTQQKVGIAEPQAPPDAGIFVHIANPLTITAASYSSGGTAGAASAGVHAFDSAGTVLLDIQNINYTVQVGSASQYQQRQSILIGGAGPFIVIDVFPPLPTPIAISAIYYFTGTTGRCVVVPSNLGSGPGDSDTSIYTQNLLATLRRGAMIKIGTEACLVRSVAVGPDNTVAIETSTAATHTTADTLTSVPAIQVDAIDGTPVAGQAISSLTATYSVTVGVGTQKSGPVTSPFVLTGQAFQPDDYIAFAIKVDNLANLNEMKILFDVSDDTFTKDFYYYAVRPSDIAAAVANTATQLSVIQTLDQRATIDEEGAAAFGNQQAAYTSAQIPPGSGAWAQIVFSVSELTRVGSDASKTLQNIGVVQFLWNASGTINVATDNIINFFGGRQPDVGDVGAPYLYRVRPRSQVTGAVGNPSPATRYGVSPRRESVLVTIPGAAYDPQIDTWDVERYGGSVTSWRFIGSTAAFAGPTTFVDNFDDNAAGAGDELDFDNFEPWPSIDVPLNATATSVTGTTALVTIPAPTNALRFLPGNLVRIGGQTVYTLWTRPTLVSGTTYLFQFVENAGFGSNLPVAIYEPAIARQFLPYMWGPDANGTVFACGDPLRLGTFYFAKNNNPDSSPDSYNIEITPASEPLLGGEVLDGLSFVGSTERWWALYPQPDNPAQRYNYVQQPFSRGLAAAQGHCNDGQSIFWWAKDGIYSSSKGALTDDDLYNLFPHEGVSGEDVTYNGVKYYAPDYSQAPKFRLTHSNGYLYAIYIGKSDGLYHTLVLDLRRMAWSEDRWAGGGNTASHFISAAYHVEQQSESSGVLNSVLLFAGRNGASSRGEIYAQTDLNNDVTTPIQGILATCEFDGGDIRAPKQWGDFFVDSVPAAVLGVSATPMSLGALAAAATIIPNSNARSRTPVSVGGIVVSDFMGLLFQWVDDFSQQALPTTFRIWQPSFDVQPARTIGWTTFGTSFGMKGFGHIRQIAIAWVSTQPITLTITTVDGQDPQPIILPSSGGQYTKQIFPLTANKGQLFVFQAASTAPFQIFEDDIEIHVGEWGREGAYLVAKSFGGSASAQSPI
jgi:hypothetical protein